MSKQILKAGLFIHCKKSFLTRQTNLYGISCKSVRNASSKNDDDDDDDFNKPIKYSTSKAATWRAAKTRNPLIDRHPHESTIISISLAVFIVYFLLLREENDIDLLLKTDLWERYPALNIKGPMPNGK